MTRCNYVQSRLRAVLDGEVPAAEQRRVELHLDTCAACRAEYARQREVIRLVRALPLEDTPPHFAANLHVRLQSQRIRPWRGWRRPRLAQARVAWRWAVGVVGALALATFAGSALLSPRLGVAEIAREAEVKWASLRNFECSIVVRGTYRGQAREFVQRLWYHRPSLRRPGMYRLETQLDYPLLTLVNETRVLHYLRGGTWDRRGPLVLIRPRKPGEEQLPFPFGLAWPTGTQGGIDQLLRLLQEDRNATLQGTEAVLGRDCYLVSFTAVPPGGRREERVQTWIDRETFLPLRITRERDVDNHLTFETQQVRINNDLLPSSTFEFQPPPGAVVIHGDVDPHVFGLRPRRTGEYDRAPLATARQLVRQLAPAVPCAPLLPDYLPDGYRLVRVSRITGRSLTAYWINDRPGRPARIIKLLVEPKLEAPPLEVERGRSVRLGEGRERRVARIASGREPFRYHYLSWVEDRTRVLLFVADLSEAEALRIARSVRPLPDEEKGGAGREPGDGVARSVMPPEPAPPQPLGAPSLPVSVVEPVAEPPMLPEMQREEHVPLPAAR